MRLKRLLVLFAFIVSSCTSGSTRVPLPTDGHGTAQDVDDILTERNYTFEFAYEGCFAGRTETLEIKDQKIAVYTFPVFSKADRVVEKVDTVSWTKEKEFKLREIFKAGIQSPDTAGSCTMTTRFALTGSVSSVAFTDRDCALSDAIEMLVK